MTRFRPKSPAETLQLRTGRRLGLQAAAIVSVIVAGLTGTAAVVVLHSQHTSADALLTQALRHADDVGDPPSGMRLSELTADGSIHTTPGARALPEADDALRHTGRTGISQAFDLHVTGGEYRVQTQRHDDGSTFGAALDLTANHAERDRLITAMLGAGGVSLLLAAGAGAWLGRRATEPLDTALTLQRRFVSDASHELRTPLTLLSTRAQLLRRRLRTTDADPDTLSTTDQVVADTQRLATILDDLLLTADPAAARASEPVDLTRLAAEVIAEAEPTATEHSIRITGPPQSPTVPTTASPDTTDPHSTAPHSTASDTTVQGSPIALRRAITALVDNAVRHADQSVAVTVHRARRHIVLEVSDDGAGVDPELASRLFDRFVSARPADTGTRRHYGLGLALVSDIATSHGGTIELARHDQPGTVFRITLPAPPSKARQTQPPGHRQRRLRRPHARRR